MIERPFKLAHRPLVPGSSLELVVTFEAPVPEEGDPFAPIAHFQEVAARGGLGGESLSPMQSTLRLSRREQLSGATWRWRYEAVRLHPSCLFILENVLHDIHLEGARIREATLSSGLVSSHGQLPEQVLPFVHEPLPFEYTFEAQGTEVLIEVDFVKEQGAESLRSFEAAWWSWLGLVQRGGFADDLFPPGTMQTHLARAPSFNPHGLQFFLEDVTAGGEAFDCFVNMLHALHLGGAAIEAVLVA